MRIFLFLLFFFVILINVILVRGEFCPINCQCSDAPRTINCSSQGSEMFSVPYLDSVEILDLSNNKFSDVPKLILFSSKLRKLNLSRNSLSSLPSNLSLLSELKVLDLSNNLFSNSNDLLGLGQLKKLEILYLSRNPLMNLDGLKSDSVRILRVDGCKIGELRNNSLDGLPKLTILKLSENPLKRIDHPSSKMLTFLDLSNCGLEILDATAFSGLTNLVYLDVSKNPVQKNVVGNLEHSELATLVVDNPNQMINQNRSGLPMLKYLTPTDLETIKYFAFSDKRSSEFSVESLAESLKNLMIGIEKYLIYNNNSSSKDSSQSYSSYVPSMMREEISDNNSSTQIQSQNYSTEKVPQNPSTTDLPPVSNDGHQKIQEDPSGFQPQISTFKRLAYILLFIGTLSGIVCIPWLLHESKESSPLITSPPNSPSGIPLESISSEESPQESYSPKLSTEVTQMNNGTELPSTSKPYPITLSSDSYVIHHQSKQPPVSTSHQPTNSSYLPQFDSGHSEQATATTVATPSTTYLQPSQLIQEISPSNSPDHEGISHSSNGRNGSTDSCVQDIGLRNERL